MLLLAKVRRVIERKENSKTHEGSGLHGHPFFVREVTLRAPARSTLQVPSGILSGVYQILSN
jgi:hypothetical protein